MRQNGMLLARHTGRRNGRLHDGKVVVMGSNLRWFSDGFEIARWNGEPSPEFNAPMGRSESTRVARAMIRPRSVGVIRVAD